MRQILIAIMLVALFGVLAKADTTNCKPKTCEENLADAKKEIARLKKQIKLLSQKEPEVKIVREVVQVEQVKVVKEEASKNIISLYAVNSQTGLKTATSNNTTEVSNKYSLGAGLMYQRRIQDKAYLGLAADSNSGTSVSIGLGF